MSAVGGDEDRDLDMPTRASTRMSRVSVKLPMSSVAGVKGDEAEKFQEYQDMSTRVKPKSHCWLPSGDVLIGCSGGQLLKVSGWTLCKDKYLKCLTVITPNVPNVHKLVLPYSKRDIRNV